MGSYRKFIAPTSGTSDDVPSRHEAKNGCNFIRLRRLSIIGIVGKHSLMMILVVFTQLKVYGLSKFSTKILPLCLSVE